MPRCHAQARARTPHTPPDKPRKTLPQTTLPLHAQRARPCAHLEVAAGGAPAPAKYYLGSASGRCPPSPPSPPCCAAASTMPTSNRTERPPGQQRASRAPFETQGRPAAHSASSPPAAISSRPPSCRCASRAAFLDAASARLASLAAALAFLAASRSPWRASSEAFNLAFSTTFAGLETTSRSIATSEPASGSKSFSGSSPSTPREHTSSERTRAVSSCRSMASTFTRSGDNRENTGSHSVCKKANVLGERHSRKDDVTAASLVPVRSTSTS
mmetsp:Transcript_28361/g.93065  ORF Transcript_28361/g.93065 Transcript_28361/m.93065 type:complete len:272 (+) Transcript_28361:127-942(+)